MKIFNVLVMSLQVFTIGHSHGLQPSLSTKIQAQQILDTTTTQTSVPGHVAIVYGSQDELSRVVEELKSQQTLSESTQNQTDESLDITVTQTAIPDHVAIIPDGNRRFAKNHKYALVEGLRKATLGTVPMITEFMWRAGVHTVSIWCFSTENWQRPIAEVCDVMQVIAEGIEQALLPLCNRMEAQIVHVGRRDRLPSYVLQVLDYAINQTRRYAKHQVNLCIDYGGQDEICRMIETLQTRNVLGAAVAVEQCNQLLDTADKRYPGPDLIIRTSGEKRLSGFFLWQSAYSELYFFDKHFPDLTNADIRAALDDFAHRQRRYGK